jgi:hypothetical protein
VLVSQSAYGRRRGVSHQAVQKRTVTAGGPIPVHGPKKLIDVAEADALWNATMAPNGAANARASTATAPRDAGDGAPRGVTGSQLAQARAAALVVDVQTKRLALEQQRGADLARPGGAQSLQLRAHDPRRHPSVGGTRRAAAGRGV